MLLCSACPTGWSNECGACLVEAPSCPSPWLMWTVAACGADTPFGAYCRSAGNTSVCGTRHDLDNCGLLGHDDVYLRLECEDSGKAAVPVEFASGLSLERAVEPEAAEHHFEVDAPTVSELEAAELGIVVGILAAVVLLTLCFCVMCLCRGGGGQRQTDLPTTAKLQAEPSYTASREFRKAEAMAHVQQARVRAREAAARESGDGPSSSAPRPRVVCLAAPAVDPCTGAVLKSSLVGRFVDVTLRSSGGSSGEGAAGGAAPRDENPVGAAREWLSGKMIKALRRDAEHFGGESSAALASERVARARDQARRRQAAEAAEAELAKLGPDGAVSRV